MLTFKKPKQDTPITDINVTPLVDVCLVLVIIFMVISPLAMQAAIEVASSKARAAKGQTAIIDNVRVDLDEKGGLRVNGRNVQWDQLGYAVKHALSASKDKLVGVNAAPGAKVGQVVEVLDVSRQSGAARLALLNP